MGPTSVLGWRCYIDGEASGRSSAAHECVAVTFGIEFDQTEFAGDGRFLVDGPTRRVLNGHAQHGSVPQGEGIRKVPFERSADDWRIGRIPRSLD